MDLVEKSEWPGNSPSGVSEVNVIDVKKGLEHLTNEFGFVAISTPFLPMHNLAYLSVNGYCYF